MLHAADEPSCLTCGWAGPSRPPDEDEMQPRRRGGPAPAGRRGAGAAEMRRKIFAALSPGEECSANDLRERLWESGAATSSSTIGDAIRGLLRDGGLAERPHEGNSRKRLYRLAGNLAAGDATEAA